MAANRPERPSHQSIYGMLILLTKIQSAHTPRSKMRSHHERFRNPGDRHERVTGAKGRVGTVCVAGRGEAEGSG